MDTLSTVITSNPNKCNCSSFKTIYSTVLCIATFSSLLLLRYSPLVLWFAANAIIFSVYKLSSSRHPNHSDQQADSVHPILASLPSGRWHDYLSPLAEPGPREKEVTHVSPVGEEDKKATKEKNMDHSWNTIRMRYSDYPSPPAEIGQREKELIHVNTVGEDHQKKLKEKNMDDTWNAIMMRCSRDAARKPSLKKSDTWERSQRRLQRADEVGMKPELKKAATYKDRREEPVAHDQQVEETTSKGDIGWRTRDVLVAANSDLFRRVENFIKKQHDHLRLQRQESEYRRFLERFCK